jgi:arginyl-tRNA synthetase
MDKIASIIKDAIQQLFSVDQSVQLDHPNHDFGDLATNAALQLAKQLKRKPLDIATELADKLRQSQFFSEVNVVAPGFINFRLTAHDLSTILDQEWKLNYGENKDGNGKTVIVEYPSQNMAKPYSIGHLRSGNQGWAAKKLMEATGWNVITDNHLGDYGAPFGIWVVGFLTYSSDEKLATDGVYELGRVYIETRKALKDEKDRGESTLADQVQAWLIKLEQGDPEALAYSKKFNAISLDHIHKVMQRLQISTDYELGESFYAPQGKTIVQELLKKGIAIQNADNSIIVPLEEYGIKTPILVQKSNGAALYATTDLATLIYRNETWHPDRMIYAVGAEQQFYFKQLAALAKKLNLKAEVVHLWFGMINQINEDGTRGKMSSRKGVVLMEELLDRADAKARAITAGRDVSDQDIHRIALGAIKFSDFAADRRTDILFNWDSIFSLTGFSGPYIQYAAVRINKIINKNDTVEASSYENYDFEPEKAILLELLSYPEIVRQSANYLEPHRIAAYLYNFARVMNQYYEQTRVTDAPDSIRLARLNLLKKVAHIFSHGLSLLGIEVPQTM